MSQRGIAMETISFLLTWGGILICLMAAISVFVIAFNVSFVWMLICFIPFGKIVFAIRHWEEARGAVVAYFCGLAIAVVGALLDPHLSDKDDGNFIHEVARVFRTGSPAEKPSNTIAMREDRIAVLQAQVTQGTADLHVIFRELTARRAALKPGDEKALAEYNLEAARYAELLESTRKAKVELDGLISRLR